MISWSALNRITERQIATDAKYRKKAAGRPLRSDAKQLTDEELLAKLRSFSIDLDRSSLGHLCDENLSAEQITKLFVDQSASKGKRAEPEIDWIWICLAALWQRWFPDRPSFEMLDDKIQNGYDFLKAGEAASACRIWLDAWANVLGLLDKTGLQSIDELDRQFRGQRIYSIGFRTWSQSFGMQGLMTINFLGRESPFVKKA